MKSDQISQTAAFIAIKFYGLTRQEPFRSLFEEEVVEFYDRLVHSLPSPLNSYHSLLSYPWIRALFTVSEELLLPGDLMHVILRKYYIQRQAAQLLDGPCEQLLVLGAGFDHLAAYHAARDIPSMELDTPRMAGLKQQFAERWGYDHPLLSFCEINFSNDSVAGRLHYSGSLSADRPTMVIAEGLFDYLPNDRADELLRELRSVFTGSLRMISTVFALEELSAFRRWVFTTGVRMVGESIELDYSLKDYRQWLASHGFSVDTVINGQTMRSELLAPHHITRPILPGFYILSARSDP